MADASYAIEIAASMPEGEATAAQLDQMIVGLTGAGKGADFFQQAIKKVSDSLGIAKAATAAANAALADGNARYAQLEKAANLAARAAEKAAAKGKLDPLLARTAYEANSALEAYSSTLRELEANAKGADAAEAKLAGTLKNLRTLSGHVDKTIGGAAESTEKLRSGLAVIPGPIGRISAAVLGPVQGFQKLNAELGSSQTAMLLTAGGAAALVLAVAALAAGLVYATVKVAAWAVGLADSARSAGLAREAAEAMTPSLAALRGVISDVDKETGLGAEALRGLAKGLESAGAPADELADHLRVAALAQKALGSEGSSAYTKLVADVSSATKAAEEAARATGSVPEKLAEDLLKAQNAAKQFATTAKAQLGGIVAQQMRGLDGQSQTLKKHISETFGGLDIEPVLRGLERLVALFDQNTAAGEAIKFLFETVFQPLINQAENAAVVVEAFALGFLIGLTKVYIAIKPAIAAVKEFFGFDGGSLTETLDLAKKAGELIVPVFLVFVGVLGLIVGAVVAVIAQFVLIQAVIYGLIAAVVYAGVQIVQGFIGAWNAVEEYLNGLVSGFPQLGTNIMQGLINGILGAGPALISALTNVVGAGVSAAKKALGIASPSKVFAEIGAWTGEGFTQGVDGEAPAAQASMANMVDPAPAVQTAQQGAAAAGEAGASGASGGPSVHIENLYLAGEKATKAETLSLAEALTQLLRGDVAALGGAEPAGTF